MPPHSWGYIWRPFQLILFFNLILLSQTTDVFCGSLVVHKQQWFAKETVTLGARMSNDLKDCLNFCCGIPDCQAVTFMGFLKKDSPNPTANCVMFQCGPNECRTITDPVATDGVVSVFIKRELPASAQLQAKDEAVAELLNNSMSDANQTMNATTPAATLSTTQKDDGLGPKDDNASENTLAPTVVFDEEDENIGPSEAASTRHTRILITDNAAPPNGSGFSSLKPRESPKTTVEVTVPTTTTSSSFLADLAPVWVVGILIVIVVVCCGVVLVLLSIYCCVRRSKTKMRSQPITSLKTPTLHAFNPTTANLNTTSTMA